MSDAKQNGSWEAVLSYLERGWPVIPLCSPDSSVPWGCNVPWHKTRIGHKIGKTPIWRWKAYQDRLPTIEEWQDWRYEIRSKLGGMANLGVMTGHFAGLVMLDLDSPEHAPDGHGPDGAEELKKRGHEVPPTLIARTPSGGTHLIYRRPSVTQFPVGTLQNGANLLVNGERVPGVDGRADAGLLVAVPSIGVNGKRYEWVNEGTQIAECPGWLIEALSKSGRPQGRKASANAGGRDGLTQAERLLIDGAPEGGWHNSLVAVAGYLRERGIPLDVSISLLNGWNQTKNKPPHTPDILAEKVSDVYVRYDDDPAPDVDGAEDLLDALAEADSDSVVWLLDSKETTPGRRKASLVRLLQYGATPSMVLGASILSARVLGNPESEALREYRSARYIAQKGVESNVASQA